MLPSVLGASTCTLKRRMGGERGVGGSSSGLGTTPAHFFAAVENDGDACCAMTEGQEGRGGGGKQSAAW